MLGRRGVQVAMLTGDDRGTAERIGGELGMDLLLADVLPGEAAAQRAKRHEISH